ncbi:unnamed protein product, partial [Ectocarpus fasciculatus]
ASSQTNQRHVPRARLRCSAREREGACWNLTFGMGIGPSYKMVVDQSTGKQPDNDSDLDWIARPPREGEPRNPPLYEKGLVAGDGPILGKGGYGV